MIFKQSNRDVLFCCDCLGKSCLDSWTDADIGLMSYSLCQYILLQMQADARQAFIDKKA